MQHFTVDGEQFRDLDHDGVLAPYEDWRLPSAARARDLLTRLSIEEKVGLLLHGTLQANGGPLGVLGIGSEYDLGLNETLIGQRHINSMITRLGLSPRELAEQNNAVQRIAACSRLGIPLTISTDPRHHVSAMTGSGVESGGFTIWPGPLGLAASRGSELVRAFGDQVRQEYRATGLHMALSPQADLATSPRWSRLNGTFGEDPGLVRQLVGAYIQGVQGGDGGLQNDSVAAVVKHWVGYGAAPDGFDGHNYYGRFSEFPGGAFDDHVQAFLDAFANHVAGVMPTYNILKDLVLQDAVIEQVGAGYSRELIAELLRGQHQFEGVVLSDWAITKDVTAACRSGEPKQSPVDVAMAWGVEDLSRVERFAKGLNAGLDQFGGEDDPEPFLRALDQGLIHEDRVDESAYRILLQKFELGLFEQPFVDPDQAEALVGNGEFAAVAREAAQRSFVFLKKPAEPLLSSQAKVYVRGYDQGVFKHRGLQTVDRVDVADVAIIKVATPNQMLHPSFFFGSRQHEGDLDFKDDDPELEALEALSASVPTIVVVEMDRPAVLSRINGLASVLVASFGGDIDALIDLLTGDVVDSGQLPYSLPASMDAVRCQTPDKPLDDPNPLYPFGYPA